MALENFRSDPKTVEAIVRDLEVIGEAVKNPPPGFRKARPAVEWKRFAELRCIPVHEYFSVDLDIIWDLILNKVSLLENRIKAILDR